MAPDMQRKMHCRCAVLMPDIVNAPDFSYPAVRTALCSILKSCRRDVPAYSPSRIFFDRHGPFLSQMLNSPMFSRPIGYNSWWRIGALVKATRG
jgi:hypothetical protein